MRVARLGLLRQCVDVAEAALEAAPGEDRFKDHGATRMVENWGDEVPLDKVT